MTSRSHFSVRGDIFADRHIGPSRSDTARMLETLGVPSLDALVDQAVPASLRDATLDLPEPLTEPEVLAELGRIASENQVVSSMIGRGYYDTHVPQVILRNILENPAWYTSYTPYQPEISQGRLEALLNFQTMICDLTGMQVANSSLLDEATAAAEAMTLARRAAKTGHTLLVDADCHPQTIAVIGTRARALDIPLEIVSDLRASDITSDHFGVIVAYPGSSGRVRTDADGDASLAAVIDAAHAVGAIAAVVADPLALVLLRSPGSLGADIVVGSAQRFGVPLGFGGPSAGYMAVRESLTRQMPGRLVGVSVDADGKAAYRLTLQTREQHIRREKATSNICTAQVLLAIMAGMYAVYHGPEGLRAIASRVHQGATALARSLQAAGFDTGAPAFFDTLRVSAPGRAEAVVAAALAGGVNLALIDHDTVGISVDETTTLTELGVVAEAFGAEPPHELGATVLEEPALRSDEILTHPVFHAHHNETSMMRYLRTLADKDLALDRTMIPLGSCTMKLNAAAEMAAITWPEFAHIHPFAPADQTRGYLRLIDELEQYLVAITGYDAVSLQPNAGSQGEYAGLLAIRAYHDEQGQSDRRICLIPSSAHGTNAASAVLAGLKVVVVACDDGGNIDLGDLAAKIAANKDQLAAIMITYPSTHGVYEETVGEVCRMVHEAGGQVYVDGANLNALVGLARPGKFGADVSHLNLHKTFAIPHGGGGPGVGPIGVRAHLAPHLPNHPLVEAAGPLTGVGPVSASPYGSASVLPISWAYIRLMGAEGLRRATEYAVLNANYLAARLSPAYPILYTGRDGRVAHECIVDLRPITHETGVTVDDVAKRLIDFGFHAPTMSFPVAGTLMVEPTESEDLTELDRFVEAMLAIRSEIDKVGAGAWPADDNPLVGAPHTAEMLAAEWKHAYTPAEAVYPVDSLRAVKYWCPVRRIDNAFGDRHLVCSCPPIEAYQ